MDIEKIRELTFHQTPLRVNTTDRLICPFYLLLSHSTPTTHCSFVDNESVLCNSVAQRVESSLPLSSLVSSLSPSCCTITSHSVDEGVIGLLLPHATRTSYSQEFKYVWLSPASLLKQVNGTFQPSVQLFSVLILLKVVIPAAYIAKQQCERHCSALLRQCVNGAARQDAATRDP